MVHYIGSRNLLLASAGFVLLAYFAFIGVTRKRVSHWAKRKGRRKPRNFSLKELAASIGRDIGTSR